MLTSKALLFTVWWMFQTSNLIIPAAGPFTSAATCEAALATQELQTGLTYECYMFTITDEGSGG